MKDIDILKKHRPYTDKIGSKTPILGTKWEVEIFPARLVFTNEGQKINVCFDLIGFIKNFHVFQELHANKQRNGDLNLLEVKLNGDFFLDYKIIIDKNSDILIYFKRMNFESIDCCIKYNDKIENDDIKDGLLNLKIYKQQRIKIIKVKEKIFHPISMEKLYLGVDKKQNMELIYRRKNICEILPIWYSFSQRFASAECNFEKCDFVNDYFEEIKNYKQTSQNEKIGLAFLKCFFLSFKSFFSPKLFDDEYTALSSCALNKRKNKEKNLIFYKSKEVIKEMFFKQSDDNEVVIFSILPFLIKEFHCGRFININCEGLGVVSILWAKKIIKKIVFKSLKDFDLKLVFKNSFSIKSFRVRKNNRKDCGKVFFNTDIIKINKNQKYVFDRFQK